MKNSLLRVLVFASTLTLLTGCLDLQLGGGSKSETHAPTLGQQLLDLQNARNSGAMSEGEYQAQRAKLLDQK